MTDTDGDISVHMQKFCCSPVPEKCVHIFISLQQCEPTVRYHTPFKEDHVSGRHGRAVPESVVANHREVPVLGTMWFLVNLQHYGHAHRVAACTVNVHPDLGLLPVSAEVPIQGSRNDLALTPFLYERLEFL